MKISFITPTSYIKEYGSQSQFTLALSHLIDLDKENEYEKIIKEIDLPIILDNSCFELHKPEGIDSLISKAVKIKADSFFAPDHLYDRIQTEKAFDIAYYCLEKRNLHNKIKINVVIQADNSKDYIESYKKFAKDDRVNLIGLSILAIPRCFGKQNPSKKSSYIHNDSEIVESRIECLKQLNQLDVHKSSHLLGLGNSIKDIIFANENCPWIYSHDSSSAFWNAINNKRILEDGEIEGGKTDVKVDFDFKDATDEQLKLAQYNINQIKEML